MSCAPAIAAVFFDFAGTLFDDRELRDVHLQQLRFVAAAAGVDAATSSESAGSCTPRIGADPGDAKPDAVISALAGVLDIVGIGVCR